MTRHATASRNRVTQPRHGSARPNHRHDHTGANECGENDDPAEPDHDEARNRHGTPSWFGSTEPSAKPHW